VVKKDKMEKRNILKIAGKDYSVGEARKLMRILRKKEEACYSKLSKIKDRINILERFINIVVFLIFKISHFNLFWSF